MTPSLQARCDEAMHAAAARAFPARPCDGPELTPVTGAPYLASFDHFASEVAGWPERAILTATLSRALCECSRWIRVTAVMIGGSLLDPTRTPRDLDGVVFYRADPQRPPQPHVLLEWATRWKTSGLDLRLVPLDGDDDGFTIKLIGYFTLLYAIGRGGTEPGRGAVVLQPPFKMAQEGQRA